MAQLWCALQPEVAMKPPALIASDEYANWLAQGVTESKYGQFPGCLVTKTTRDRSSVGGGRTLVLADKVVKCRDAPSRLSRARARAPRSNVVVCSGETVTSPFLLSSGPAHRSRCERCSTRAAARRHGWV